MNVSVFTKISTHHTFAAQLSFDLVTPSVTTISGRLVVIDEIGFN